MTTEAGASLGLIWAQAHDRVIGAGGTMPWRLPEDLAHFKALTLGSTVVMGRRTWESFPPKFRPLPGRRNVVLTRDAGWSDEGAERVASLADALALGTAGQTIWVIGGGQLYAEALPLADVVELTEIDLDVDGDTQAPALDDTWATDAREPVSGWLESSTGLRFRYRTLRRSPDKGPHRD